MTDGDGPSGDERSRRTGPDEAGDGTTADRSTGTGDGTTADHPAEDGDAESGADDASAGGDTTAGDPRADGSGGDGDGPTAPDSGDRADPADEWGRPLEGTELPELREEIRAIDREIVELIARRTYVADTIARVKERRGLPTVDENQERRVMDRAGENAARFDVDRNLVKAVFRMLIELNKIEQRSRRTGTADFRGSGDEDRSGRDPESGE